MRMYCPLRQKVVRRSNCDGSFCEFCMEGARSIMAIMDDDDFPSTIPLDTGVRQEINDFQNAIPQAFGPIRN